MGETWGPNMAQIISGPNFHKKFNDSLQGKIVVTDENLKVVYEDSVSYDNDLPEFGTNGGIHVHEDKSITAPTAMFVKALDKLLEKMMHAGFPFENIAAIAGATQCNGSVYWRHGSGQKLRNLDSDKPLYDQLYDAFSVTDAPTWMDSTATEQSRNLEEAVGGQTAMIRMTGSRAFENCTAAEIMKIFQTQRDAYENTERISLISSLMTSLFIGDYAPIEYGDASTTSLLDIHKKCWATKCLELCGNGLAEKLQEPQHARTAVGNVSSYFIDRYGFSCSCKLPLFTGDIIQSVVGIPAKHEDLILSLGTADCLLKWSDKANQSLIDRTMVSALDENSYFSLIAFKNGSLTRQRVMERCAGSWENFSKLLESTSPGNNGNIGMYFDVIEKQPLVTGQFRFNKDDQLVTEFSSETEVRAVLEGQTLARRMYMEKAGYRLGPEARIFVTGGASINKDILQVVADIFCRPVYTTDVPNSAALGGCHRAKLMAEGSSTLLNGHPEPSCVAVPNPRLEAVYNEMLLRYEKLEVYVAAKYGENTYVDT